MIPHSKCLRLGTRLQYAPNITTVLETPVKRDFLNSPHLKKTHDRCTIKAIVPTIANSAIIFANLPQFPLNTDELCQDNGKTAELRNPREKINSRAVEEVFLETGCFRSGIYHGHNTIA